MVILEAQCQVFFQFFSKQLRVTIPVSTQWFPALQPGGHCVTGQAQQAALFTGALSPRFWADIRGTGWTHASR